MPPKSQQPTSAKPPSPHLYRVLYTFHPQTNIELSCQVGDILITDASPTDDWLLVTKYWDLVKDGDAEPQKGYVPVSFIERMTPQQESKFLAANSKEMPVLNSKEGTKERTKSSAPKKRKSATATKRPNVSSTTSATADKASKANETADAATKEESAQNQTEEQQQDANDSRQNDEGTPNDDTLNDATSDRITDRIRSTPSSTMTSRRLHRQSGAGISTTRSAFGSTAPGTGDVSFGSTKRNATTFGVGGRRSLDNHTTLRSATVHSSYSALADFNGAAPSSSRRTTFGTTAPIATNTTSLVHQLFDRLATERNTLFDDYNQELHKTNDFIQESHREAQELIHRIRQLEGQIDIEQNNLKAQHGGM